MSKLTTSTIWALAGAMGMGIILLSAVAGLWWAFAATVLWGWFVTPTFGLGAPPLAAMYGIILTITAMTKHHYRKEPDDEAGERLAGVMLYAFSGPLILLGIGWVASHFV